MVATTRVPKYMVSGLSKPILVNGPGARMQAGMVAVVVEGEVRAGRDATGQILQTFQQIGLGLDERRLAHQLFGLGDGVGQRLCIHRRAFRG